MSQAEEPVEIMPSVVTELSRELTRLDAEKYRVKTVFFATFVVAPLFLFFSNFKPLLELMTTDFSSIGTYFAWACFVLGIAFGGKDLAENFRSLVSVLKSVVPFSKDTTS